MSIFTVVPLFSDKSHYIGSFFSLQIAFVNGKTVITMTVTTPVVNTTSLPSTHRMLKSYLPTILASQCFNDAELPFSEEVCQTEIGHLFEHILLEYLCELKLKKGYDEAIYAGRTKWNWDEDPFGTFHILINTNNEDVDILPAALRKTIDLMKIIYRADETAFSFANLNMKGEPYGPSFKKSYL